VAPLAEAAEKYDVFAAMNICQIRMEFVPVFCLGLWSWANSSVLALNRNFLPAHAEGVMAYAAKHGYRDIVDKVAPLVVPLPTGNVIPLLPQHLVIPWVSFLGRCS
jgi:hypothetical protein